MKPRSHNCSTVVGPVVSALLIAVWFSACAAETKIEYASAKADWPRPCLLIPELPAAPKMDGVIEHEIWDTASEGALRFPLGSSKPIAPDTTFRIGHRAGVLYLVLEYDWPDTSEPVALATGHDSRVSADDGGEIFFAPINDLSQARQLLFNLKGVQADKKITVADGLFEDSSWNPNWQLACRRDGKSYVAEFAIPFSEISGVEGRRGDIFRLALGSHRVRRSPAIAHWSPIRGMSRTSSAIESCSPDYFGFAVLTGPKSQKLAWEDVHIGDGAGLIFMDKRQIPAGLLDSPVSFTLLNPVAEELGTKAPSQFVAELTDGTGKTIASQQASLNNWPQRCSVEPGSAPEGDYRFELRVAGSKTAAFSTLIRWRPSIRIEAEDSEHVEGTTQVFEHPRSVGTLVLSLNPGSRTRVSQYGRAVYLCLPPTFPTPGAQYDSATGTKLLCRVDDRPAPDIWFATARRIVPLAEDLKPGRHVIEVALAEGRHATLDAFVFSTQPLSVVQGVVVADGYSELLMEVRADLFAGDKLIRSEYVRNPVNGTFDLLDIAPGTYRPRFTANGFGARETAPFTIARAGEKIDLGVIVLPFDRDLIRYWSYTHPSISTKLQRTFNLTPGDSFHTEVELPGPLQRARLVSRFKTIDLKVEDTHQTPPVHTHSPLHALTMHVPPETPYDMYTLDVTFKSARGEQTNRWSQSVSVREPLARSFAIAGVGHMNTWGQQTSEYLGRVAELVQLAGARVLLIANEVNAAYIAGALKELRIPYAITAGNHTMARWDDFFPQRCQAFDDGPLRIVTFANQITASWSEARDLLNARKDATSRILLCYEAFPPLDLIRDGKVNLLFDGHSGENHPQLGQFPPRTLHLRTPSYESVRWISMSHDGLAPSIMSPKDVPSFRVPREGNLPLRVEFSAANNGTASALTARIVNETGIRFPCARVRLLLRAGNYAVSGAKVLQAFLSDDGKVTVIDVETEAPSGLPTEIIVRDRNG